MPGPRPSDPLPQPDRLTAMRLALLTYAVPSTIVIMALLYSARLFIVLQGEALILNSAAQPARAILGQFGSGLIGQVPSPFYVLGLHFWLRLTGGAFFWLRIPSALFYLAGLGMLARVAHYWGKEDSATTLLFLAAFWPYGFHYGSLLTWYSFAFMLIAALTWAYLSFKASPRFTVWYIFCLLGVALLYITYIGWALLILFCVEDVLRNRGRGPSVASRWLASFAFLAVAYTPQWPELFRAFRRSLGGHLPWIGHGRALGLNALYNVYVLLASESIAPWFWRFGVPIALAILVCLVLAWMGIGAELRRFWVFAAVLLLLMDLAGILRGQTLMLVAPWFLLPLAVALSTLDNRYRRRALLLSLVVMAGLAWYGIYDRDHYATGDFYEPWPSVAAGAALAMREGGNVMSNSPQFFFYLTYSLQEPPSPRWRFVGSLPETVRDPQVWDPAEWQAAGRPLRPYMLWIRSTLSDDTQGIDDAGQWLDQHCGGRLNRYIARDPAYPWMRDLLPQAAPATPWLIETHQYTCEQPPEAAPAPGSRAPQPATPTPKAPAQPAPIPAH